MSYTDESGVPHGGKREGKFFILSAVMVEDSHWNEINADIIKIKQKHFPDIDPDVLEIHMYDILQSKKEYVGITIERRDAFLTDIFNIFKNHELAVISIVIKKKELESKYDVEHLEKTAWKSLVEQIEGFLASREKYGTGVMIVDSKGRYEDARINRYVKTAKKNGIKGTPTSHLIEDVFFTSSDERNFVQLADVAAHCTRQHMYERSDIENYWRVFESKLWCDDSGECAGFGLKIIS